MEQPLPDWLTAGDPPAPKPSREGKRLAFVQFDMIFPRVLERICEGYTLTKAVKELPVEVDSGAFYRWLRKDPEKYALYKEAKEIRTEEWAGRIIDHATAMDSEEDVSRSKLIIDTYKWLMGADNRKVYGDTKQIEVTSTISITAALQQAQGRIVDAEYEVLDEPTRLLSSGEDEDE